MSVGDYIRGSQIWKSLFRDPVATERRDGMVPAFASVFSILHPVPAGQQGIAITYTWCMGGMTSFLFLVEALTGVLLMFSYRPTVEFAYHDILALRDVATLGIVREIHRWAAHAIVIAVWLHMYGVFLTGSYKPPREFNWVLGVLLLALTLLMSFTGYVLPWDQLAMGAITAGSNVVGATPIVGNEGPGSQILNIGGHDLITSGNDARFLLLGGRSVSEATLNRFYVLHCVAIPLVMSLLIAIHLWRVRRDHEISQSL